MPYQFPGVALVTGAASGIGQATAKLFASEGCKKIVIADLNESGLRTAKQKIEAEFQGVVVLDIIVDISKEESINDMIKAAVKKFCRIDYACNVAGILIPGPSDDFLVEQWDKQTSINMRGTWLCQKLEIIQMRKQESITVQGSKWPARGTVANVASMAGLRGFDNTPSYCATKSAVIAFSRTDGMRYAKENIRVNCICPALTMTPFLLSGPPPDMGGITVEEALRDQPIGRFADPEEMAEALIWLSSSRSSFVTGAALPVNGGMVG